MANRPPFTVTTTIKDLTSGLTEGSNYHAQHVGGSIVRYADAPNQPTLQTDIAWFVLREGESIRFTSEAADKTWVRTERGEAVLAINEL